MEKSLSETNCISCGNCIDVCPTGAISENFQFKILGILEKENIETICNFCSLGCKVNFKKISDDIYFTANSTEDIKDSPNKGFLCAKGDSVTDIYLRNVRIHQACKLPQWKVQHISLDDAFQQSAERLKQIIKDTEYDSVLLLLHPNLQMRRFIYYKICKNRLGNNNINNFSNMLYRSLTLLNLTNFGI